MGNCQYDLPQVTSCGPGPVSLPGTFISCGYFPGGLVGPMIALAQALTLPTISTGQLTKISDLLPNAQPCSSSICQPPSPANSDLRRVLEQLLLAVYRMRVVRKDAGVQQPVYLARLQILRGRASP